MVTALHDFLDQIRTGYKILGSCSEVTFITMTQSRRLNTHLLRKTAEDFEQNRQQFGRRSETGNSLSQQILYQVDILLKDRQVISQVVYGQVSSLYTLWII